jgi:hypothetical protein
MNIAGALEALKQELAMIDHAIRVFEQLAAGRGRRRGRPPGWMSEPKRRGRPKGSKNKPKTPEAAN